MITSDQILDCLTKKSQIILCNSFSRLLTRENTVPTNLLEEFNTKHNKKML